MADGEHLDHVVGVGASAGGLDALERLLSNVPREGSMAFVVAQHLSPDHKSMMVELLGKRARLPVQEAQHEQRIEPGKIYLVPAHANVTIARELLLLGNRAAPHTPNLPIDQMMRSLAETYGDRAIGVVLSGTGSDGREGILAIKAAGGIAFVQDPATARFDGMPREAIRTGVVDAVLAPEDIATELGRLGGERELLARLTPRSEPRGAFDALADELRRAKNFDLRAYKRATVLRRLERRLAASHVDDLDAYVAYTRDHPAEVEAFIQELLINVTEFFRDPEVFESLFAKTLPELQSRVVAEQLRVWVPGCSTGQEVYSLAMLLSDLGGDFKIFGTDLDQDALARAAAGIYPSDEVVGISPERLARYFVRRDDGYEVDRELRKRTVFAPHDLLSDPPFTRMHLVSCRNLLIYFTPEAQRRVLDAFAFALRPGGILVLGPSEVVGDVSEHFHALEHRLKFFVRRDVRLVPTIAPAIARPVVTTRTPTDEEQATNAALRLLIDRVAPAAVLVDERMRLVRVFGNAGGLLTLPVGPPSLELLDLLPSKVRAVAGVAVHRALATREEVVLGLTEPSPELASLRAIPFQIASPAARFTLLVFERALTLPSSVPPDDATRIGQLEHELDAARRSLQAAIEELETSNEELQATNEELLASNEELQATNEELQSVNEELHTVNVEHQARISDLSETNADLDNLLNATPIATLFLDDKLRIRRFNPPVERLFSVVDSDRGRLLASFTSRLRDVDLVPELEKVRAQASTLEREVETNYGARYIVRAVPHIGPGRRLCGVVLTLSDVTALHATRAAHDRLQSVLDGLPAHVAVLDEQGTIELVNAAWTRFAEANGGGASALSVGANYLDACRDTPDIRSGLEAILAGRLSTFRSEYSCHTANEKRWYVMDAARTRTGGGVVVAHTDVTRTRTREADA